jgi:hypothetical protein
VARIEIKNVSFKGTGIFFFGTKTLPDVASLDDASLVRCVLSQGSMKDFLFIFSSLFSQYP